MNAVTGIARGQIDRDRIIGIGRVEIDILDDTGQHAEAVGERHARILDHAVCRPRREMARGN